MTKIYLTCFNVGIAHSDEVIGYALCEDGHCLASHLSSGKGWFMHDMGYESNWHHDVYKEHCPEGYELIWIDDAENDERWIEAMELNKQLFDKENAHE